MNKLEYHISITSNNLPYEGCGQNAFLNAAVPPVMQGPCHCPKSVHRDCCQCFYGNKGQNIVHGKEKSTCYLMRKRKSYV